MARHVLDYNPITGETVYFDYHDGERVDLVHVQDVNKIMDGASELRNEEQYSRDGIKNDMWHYARIPNAVMLEMKQKHGVNMMKGSIDWPAVFKCINAHYPWLKTTTKTHV